VGTDIYVFGGETEGDEYDDEDSVMKYDTVADVWSTLGPMPHARAEHSASVCNGLVYIVGKSDI
jgi:N-acetylneuraminic acid mutarotase